MVKTYQTNLCNCAKSYHGNKFFHANVDIYENEKLIHTETMVVLRPTKDQAIKDAALFIEKHKKESDLNQVYDSYEDFKAKRGLK